jgi:hypothetical protein
LTDLCLQHDYWETVLRGKLSINRNQTSNSIAPFKDAHRNPNIGAFTIIRPRMVWDAEGYAQAVVAFHPWHDHFLIERLCELVCCYKSEAFY